MADMHIDGFDAYHYAARKKQTLELYRDQIPTAPGRLGGTGWNETAGKATTFTQGLLRNQSLRRYIRETNPYAIVDMEDIRYTIRQGRYSDKQTTKRSFPIPALM